MSGEQHVTDLNAEHPFHVLFQLNPFPMWVFDIDTLAFLAVNDAAIARYGYSREQFLAMSLADIRPAEDVAALRTTVARRPELGDTWYRSGPWRHVCRSGELIDVEILSHAMIYEGREARMVIAVDVTEQRQREERLQQAEERMRFALGAAGIGIWQTNLQTGTAYWSELCERIHGLEPGTFGQTFDAFLACIHPDDRDQARRIIEDAIRDRHPARFEYRTRWPDGTERRVVSIAQFFYDGDGAATRGAGVVIDVTEQRATEAQLRQAQKMEAIGQLAGGIAHDFNNMLTAILGNTAFLLEDAAPGSLEQQLLDEIRKAGEGAATLTRQLLAFSRQQVLKPQVLRLGDVVEELTPMLRRLLGATIDLRTVIRDSWHVTADAGQLQQVVINLAVNARDAMRDGGSLILETSNVELDETYASRQSDRPDVHAGPHVMLAVSDTGHGMDAATARRIFEPFFTTKPKGRGTGLGLATVHGIVKQSGGHIWVYSEVGRGTTFRVYLPRAAEPEREESRPRTGTDALRGTEAILMIEDEDIVRDFAVRALSRYGYQVQAVSTPEQAIAFADTHGRPIDLILTDVVLPGMNGRTMAERIRERHPEARTLFVSGYTDDAIVHHGVLEAGMAFLEKPFSADALARKVRDVLDGRA